MQYLIAGNHTQVSQHSIVWRYNFQHIFIGPHSKPKPFIALCNAPISGSEGLDIYPVSPGGLFSWMVPSPLSKLISHIPISRAIGTPLDIFYADNRPLCPSQKQVNEFLDGDQDEPCYMLNFFKYKSLWRIFAYGMSASRHQYTLKSKMIWSARCLHPDWDEAAIFKYPSRRVFIEMLSRKNYQQAELKFREKGWADTQLFVLSQDTAC